MCDNGDKSLILSLLYSLKFLLFTRLSYSIRGMANCLLKEAMNSLDIHLNLDNYCLFLYIFKALDTIHHRAQEKAYDLPCISLRKISCIKKLSANKWLSSSSPCGKES